MVFQTDDLRLWRQNAGCEQTVRHFQIKLAPVIVVKSGRNCSTTCLLFSVYDNVLGHVRTRHESKQANT